MSLKTRERGLIHGGGLIFGWKNVLLIWGAYIWGSLYTGGGEGLFMEFYGIYTHKGLNLHSRHACNESCTVHLH